MCHCEEGRNDWNEFRTDEAIYLSKTVLFRSRLLRFARNDGSILAHANFEL